MIDAIVELLIFGVVLCAWALCGLGIVSLAEKITGSEEAGLWCGGIYLVITAGYFFLSAGTGGGHCGGISSMYC